MRRNPINFLYSLGHMILWCVEVDPVANAREGSTQEHDWARVPIGGHGHVICKGNLGGFVSQENTPEGRTDKTSSKYFPYKQISGKNGDYEWLRITNSFIVCDLEWKVQKSQCSEQRR